MIFIESYNGIGGGQKILAKITNLHTKLYPQFRSYLILTAPSIDIKNLFNKDNLKIIDVETKMLNEFGDFRAWLSISRILSIIPFFIYYQFKIISKLSCIKDKKVFLCDYRALVIFLIPCFLLRKKVFFYLIGGSPFNNFINKFLANFIFKTYCISDELAKDLELKDYKLVRNGIDITSFCISSQNINLKLNKFVFIGTLSQNKGLHRAILSLKADDNSDWSLDIYGTFLNDDSYEDYLKNLVLNDQRITFHGFHHNISEELKKYSTLIFPSVIEDTIVINGKKIVSTSSEGSPTTIIEAVLSGLKVIANDVTGVKDLSEILPNIKVINWEKIIENGQKINLIRINNEINYDEIKQYHKDLFDKNIIDKELLKSIYND